MTQKPEWTGSGKGGHGDPLELDHQAIVKMGHIIGAFAGKVLIIACGVWLGLWLAGLPS